MAKKKFNVSSTLNRNKEPQLAPKVPLRKSPKDIEEVKDKVEQLHQPEEEVPAPPAKANQPTKTRTKAEKVKETPPKLVRMTIDTPELMHKRLKIKSIEMGISIRDYILRLIEKDLK